MKKVALITILLMLCAGSFSQSKATEIVHKMNALIAENKNTSDVIEYDKNSKSLLFDGLMIPVTSNVIVKRENKNGKSFAIFYFQEGEAVVKQNDVTWRRAHYEMPFKTGKQAADFIDLFRKLNTLINK